MISKVHENILFKRAPAISDLSFGIVVTVFQFTSDDITMSANTV